jgi:NADPH:quinone reductase-like Zn-dependent oxidoreductase
MAIQIAKARGARVVTTVGGPEQAARVRDLGADLAINYRTEDFAEHGPYDVILDVIGGHYLQRNVHSSALERRLVIIGLQNGLEANSTSLNSSSSARPYTGPLCVPARPGRKRPSWPRSRTTCGHWSRTDSYTWSSTGPCP